MKTISIKTVGRRRFRVTQWGDTSAKYGLCEVCGSLVSDFHNMVEFEPLDSVDHLDPPEVQADPWVCKRSVAGHLECLEGMQSQC